MKTFGDIIAFLRRDTLRDSELPYLFSDEALYECVAQAHDEFAETVEYIRDQTTDMTAVQLEVGVTNYVLDASILAILSAKYEPLDRMLVRASSPSLDGYTPPPDTLQWLETINYGQNASGPPQAFTTDARTEGVEIAGTIRIWPTPTVAEDGQTVRLRVVRLPAVRCTADTLEAQPECPRQFLMALVHGAAAIAYDSQDADLHDPQKAKKQRELFDSHITRAKLGIRRKLFQPMSWGFGRGGF